MADKERVWYDLRPHEFRFDSPEGIDDSEDLLLGGLEDKVKVLRRLPPGEYVVVAQIYYGEDQDLKRLDTSAFQNGIELLRGAGLDIGKGDAEYGYRMPIPEKDANTRELIVFRRK